MIEVYKVREKEKGVEEKEEREEEVEGRGGGEEKGDGEEKNEHRRIRQKVVTISGCWNRSRRK